jgi:SNF2 family DNA or RNA helicase
VKTVGMSHQMEGLRRLDGRKYFALFMEMGTGKTWTTLADAERLFLSKHINALLVIAPNGVHTNWVRREIPTHMNCEFIARAWKSGACKRDMTKIEEVLKLKKDDAAQPLRILAMNVDALITKSGQEFAERFLNTTKALFVIDESTRIKNPTATRTKNIMKLRHKAVSWRILSGTPITNAPLDLFSQFEFLKTGLLGTTSYRAFVAEYAELMRPDHPMMIEMAKKNPRIAHAQIVAKNKDGSPRWRNLEKLKALIEPHSFRVLKKDCLELPEKIYQNHYFELGAKQRAAYDLMQSECRINIDSGDVLSVSELSALVKLQQITSGFLHLPTVAGGGIHYVADANPRLESLLEIVEDYPEKMIVWARFKEELSSISLALKKVGRKVVEYHGDVNKEDRELAVDSFQCGNADVFLGQPQSGGIGLTLTAAELVIYFSNDFNFETRKQSEDRAHRIGTKNSVVYIDLIATGTIDEQITKALRRKETLAKVVLGD